jgi:hypothetical protein
VFDRSSLYQPPRSHQTSRPRSPARFRGSSPQRHKRNAPNVSISQPDSTQVRIATSALLELADWIESRWSSCQGGFPCNPGSAPVSPPANATSESVASHTTGPALVQSSSAQSPAPNPGSSTPPAPKVHRRRQAGGGS